MGLAWPLMTAAVSIGFQRKPGVTLMDSRCVEMEGKLAGIYSVLDDDAGGPSRTIDAEL